MLKWTRLSFFGLLHSSIYVIVSFKKNKFLSNLISFFLIHSKTPWEICASLWMLHCERCHIHSFWLMFFLQVRNYSPPPSINNSIKVSEYFNVFFNLYSRGYDYIDDHVLCKVTQGIHYYAYCFIFFWCVNVTLADGSKVHCCELVYFLNQQENWLTILFTW